MTNKGSIRWSMRFRSLRLSSTGYFMNGSVREDPNLKIGGEADCVPMKDLGPSPGLFRSSRRWRLLDRSHITPRWRPLRMRETWPCASLLTWWCSRRGLVWRNEVDGFSVATKVLVFLSMIVFLATYRRTNLLVSTSLALGPVEFTQANSGLEAWEEFAIISMDASPAPLSSFSFLHDF